MDTAALITVVMLEYGAATDTAARAEVLKLLNQAQREVWFAHPWWFKLVEADFSFQSGIATYTISTDYSDVRAMYNADGNRMTRLPNKLLGRVVRAASPPSGTPLAFGMDPWSSTTKQLKIRVSPTPNASNTGKAIYEQRVSDLTDSGSDYSLIPEECRDILVEYAKEHIARKGDRAQSAQMHQLAREEILQRMKLKDAELNGGMV